MAFFGPPNSALPRKMVLVEQVFMSKLVLRVASSWQLLACNLWFDSPLSKVLGRVPPPHLRSTQGTVEYTAPELLHGGHREYTEKSDMWSLGSHCPCLRGWVLRSLTFGIAVARGGRAPSYPENNERPGRAREREDPASGLDPLAGQTLNNTHDSLH